MADDLDDWETADIESTLSKPAPVPVSAAKPAFETKGEAILAKINGPDMSQFEDEDANFTAPVEYSVPASQPKKKEEKKYREERVVVDTPLDDPIAEKLRQQKLVELADYEAARELFDGAVKPLDSYLPKSLKEFEEFAAEIAARHVVAHRDNKHFKAFIKALVKASVEPLGPDEVKDVETCLAGVRSDKVLKKKKEDDDKKNKGGKKTLNLGKGGISAGLDDYVYEDAALDDGDDFM